MERNAMGLKVHSLARFPSDFDRDFYVYLLDFGWEGPLERGLQANFDRMASLASRNSAVVIAGFDGEEFMNEVFSYHRINGVLGEEVLPAILVTTCHPHRFAEQNEFHKGSRSHGEALYNDRMVLIPLKPACKNESDLIDLIERLFRDIRDGKALRDFSIHREISQGGAGAIVDALVLQPNFFGLGVDLKLIGRFLKTGFWPSGSPGSTDKHPPQEC